MPSRPSRSHRVQPRAVADDVAIGRLGQEDPQIWDVLAFKDTDDIAPEDVRQAFGQLAATLSLETLDEIPEEVATALGIRPQQAR